MVFTTYGRERVALMLGSDLSNQHIGYFAIGDGSGAELVSNKTLVNETSRFAITGSPDFNTSRKVIFQGDLNSSTFSGTSLTEFGLFASGAAGIGSLFSRETLTGSVVGDGTIEIRFESAIEAL